MGRSSHQAAPRSLLTGLAASNVSTHAEAEALLAHARRQILNAREGDDIPISARLTALGEVLRLERKLKHSGSETDAPVALQSSTGAVAANTTTDMHPWVAYRNASSSSASMGGDDGGESGDDTHEREREWE